MEPIEVLDRLAEDIGSTPLLEFRAPVDWNLGGCRIFCKAEYLNPSGSHYDRVYEVLLREQLAEIQKMRWDRGDRLLEVSSGNAGASFAMFCRRLGWPCRVILPQAAPLGFRRHILAQNPDVELHISWDHGAYLSGANADLIRQLRDARMTKRNFRLINHSHDDSTLRATGTIGAECVGQLARRGVTRLDYYVVACGNGATIAGTGERLRESYPEVRVIAFEPEEAQVATQLLNPRRGGGRAPRP